MTISEYIKELNSRFKTGISTEHTYRADLQQLIKSIAPDVMVTNEPSRIACGAPDYIITKKNIPVGYIEAKDIGKSLDGSEFKEQFDRYKSSLANLIITDYLEFRLYREGIYVLTVKIGEISGNKIIPQPDQFIPFTNLISDFCVYVGQTIKSASKLSKMMAGKARLLSSIIEKALLPDESDSILNEPQYINLHSQYESFKQVLIHDITEKAFADIYAQTIAYGMFAARFHDPTLETFTRQEAAELIPKSNPFLRKLFQYIAGYDLDDRIKWIVDDLADIFRATNVADVLKDFGKSTEQRDPMIHFYETFLSEYDPKLRKKRGVYYTPEPVVNFIVRAVDDILKDEFGITQGLADTSKVKIKVKDVSKATSDLRSKTKEIEREEEVHKVQILDPAAGTGTFLTEVIKQIYRRFEGQQGVWSKYVEEHLIPRLNGFEILMASYAMAHLKLEMLLNETGYKPTKDQRLRIYLTNSLEEHHPDTGTLFANWLSTEANEANHVKKDTPVMVVIGNPPYSVSSSNKGEWIKNLISDYKKELKEKKLNLDDDYIKFIKYGEYLIEKNVEGVLAIISNNSFIDGITHRQMRKKLLNTFDKIYILDLHGSAKKRETTLEGTKDENVFDIQQGVSINIFIKNNKRRNEIGRVFLYDFWGLREEKYNKLFTSPFRSFEYKEVKVCEPYYFFVHKDFRIKGSYDKFFSLSDLFMEMGSGVKTERDRVCIHFTRKEIENTVDEFHNGNELFITANYNLNKDSRDWKLKSAIEDINNNYSKNLYIQYDYRPFDIRWTFYTGSSRGFIGTPGPKRAYQLIGKDNIALVVCRQQSTFDFQHVLFSKRPSDICFLSSQTKETGYIAPLYIYERGDNLSFTNKRIHNLNSEILNQISNILDLHFSDDIENIPDAFTPINVLDYIYAVLYNPSYRIKYKELLKIDFPRIPYPKDKKTFWQLVKLGGELRQIHLLESSVVDKYITTYPINGNNEVVKVKYEDKKVCINPEQYFDKVPEVAWNFYIGGYQPAQKWLKDRKGRTLSYEDIMHYQKIIVALNETDRLMKEIDKINFLES